MRLLTYGTSCDKCRLLVWVWGFPSWAGSSWWNPRLGRAGLWRAGDHPCCSVAGAGLMALGAEIGSWAMGRVGRDPEEAEQGQSGPLLPSGPLHPLNMVPGWASVASFPVGSPEVGPRPCLCLCPSFWSVADRLHPAWEYNNGGVPLTFQEEIRCCRNLPD